MASLKLERLTKVYPKNPVPAVKEFSIEIGDGEFIALLGPSGCGKTSTLRMIAGLESVTSGEIYIGNRLINGVHPKDRNVGLAFENYALYPPLTVYENLAFNLRAKGVDRVAERKRIKIIAELLNIQDIINEKPLKLSGGQKQRVNIARALVREPEVLLLDEPLSHLDARMRLLLRTELKRLHYNTGSTAVLVTHDQLEAMALADRIAIMNDGVLQQYDTPHNVFNFPANEFVASFIGEPQMNIFSATLKATPSPMLVLPNTHLGFQIPTTVFSQLSGRKLNHVRIGVRPHRVKIFRRQIQDSIPASILVLENLGDETGLLVKCGDINLIVTLPITRDLKVGTQIYLQLDPYYTVFFDDSTGERITVRYEDSELGTTSSMNKV